MFNRYIKMFEMVDEDDEGRPSPMTCVAISPSVRRVATGMSGGLLKVFSRMLTYADVWGLFKKKVFSLTYADVC